MPASRTLGYDKDGLACYYQHAFALGEPRSDDDEEFYEAIVHGEEVHARRLRDEPWLGLERRAKRRRLPGQPRPL